MSAPSTSPELDVRTCRRFGLVTGSILVGPFGLLLPWLSGRTLPVWPFAVGGLLVVLALAAPRALRPVYLVWMKVGAALGWLNTRILLSFVFIAVVTPMGCLARLFGKDPLTRRRDAAAKSYRIACAQRPAEAMKEPF